jgi:hypothetical protein
MDDTDLNLEAPLRDALRRRRELTVPGFTDRAMVAIHSDTRRRKVIRWVSISAPLAGCAALLALFIGNLTDSLNPDEADFALLISAHDKVIVSTPRLEDADALVAFAFSESTVMAPGLDTTDSLEELMDLVLSES